MDCMFFFSQFFADDSPATCYPQPSPSQMCSTSTASRHHARKTAGGSYSPEPAGEMRNFSFNSNKISMIDC